ncbi:MAG: GHKL domain-containing protein [Defluviitaleaceae bacterium]|nr:GHKL domain-containing protein [Defluviitaleaceae bacterium]
MKKFLLLLVVVCAVAASVFYLMYKYDNAYTAFTPTAENGVIFVGEQTLAENPIIWLINGWEYYGGRLLAPDDFIDPTLDTPTPDGIIYIGQFGGFEAGDPSASPHGSASYRLRVNLPDTKRTYAFYIPEIYSAYKLYINGALVLQMGEPDPQGYRPATGRRIVSAEASGGAEILLAVSDFSHMYSGVVYPPAFGEPQAIHSMESKRVIFNAGVVVAALIIGLISLLIGLLYRRNALWLMYSLACLFFVGYASYPAMQALGLFHSYMVESVAYCGMFVLIMLIQRKLGHVSRLGLYFIVAGCLVGVVSLAFHLSLPNMSLDTMLAYSRLVGYYGWGSAFAITFVAFSAIKKGEPTSKGIICGIVIFSCSLVMDRLFPAYSPIIFGWYVDIAGFVFILIIGGIISTEVHFRYISAILLEEDVKATSRLLGLQTSHYEDMLANIANERKLRHDFRHHISVINEYVRQGEYEGLARHINEMTNNAVLDMEYIYCENTAVNAVVGHYLTKAREAGVTVSAKISVPKKMAIKDTDLCIIFGNCLENAVEACERQASGERFIRISTVSQGSAFAVKIENSFDGNSGNSGNSGAQVGGVFSGKREGQKGIGLSVKREGQGIGLASVAETAAKYGGSVRFEGELFVFRASVVLYGG